MKKVKLRIQVNDLANYNDGLNVLVVGGTGQIGSEIKALRNSNINLNFPDSKIFNLVNPNSIKDYLNDSDIDFIINAGAYTKVDKAEEEKEICNSINNLGAKELAKESYRRNIGLIHISTDYVFGRNNSGPFDVNSKKDPINYYGYSKSFGEDHVLIEHKDSLVIRMASLFSEYGDNFVKRITNLLLNETEVRVISDQRISLTYAGDFSNNILKIIDLYNEKGSNDNNRIIHFACSGYSDWYSVAEVIYNEIKFIDKDLIKANLIPILLNDWTSRALRAKDTRLKIDDTYFNDHNIELSSWKDSVRVVVRSILEEIVK